ncbi:unnamed protein product, partial [Mesorhabditis spiculigera]
MPCNGNASDCVVHVFRIKLTENINGSTREYPVDLPMKRRSKYGKNVYAPVGNLESHQLAEKIIEKMPNTINKDVKERVRKEEFLISPVDDREDPHAPPPEEIGAGGEIEETQRRHTERTTTNDNAHGIAHTIDEAFPLILLLLLVAIGVVVGILCTCLGLFLIDYRRKPHFDRSVAISYKRHPSGRQALLEPQGRTTVIHKTSVTRSSRPPPSHRPPRASRPTQRYVRTDVSSDWNGHSSRESSRHFTQGPRQSPRPPRHRKRSF